MAWTFELSEVLGKLKLTIRFRTLVLSYCVAAGETNCSTRGKKERVQKTKTKKGVINNTRFREGTRIQKVKGGVRSGG